MKTVLISIFIKIIIIILLILILYKIIVMSSNLPINIIEKYADTNAEDDIDTLILSARTATSEATSEVARFTSSPAKDNINLAEKKVENAYNTLKHAFNIFHNLYSEPIDIINIELDDGVSTLVLSDGYPQPAILPSTLSVVAPPPAPAPAPPAKETAAPATPAEETVEKPVEKPAEETVKETVKETVAEIPDVYTLDDIDLPKELIVAANALIKSSK
jgi:hypothetical protein